MKDNKEKWIEEILQSAKGMRPAEANPYLASRVEAKVQQPEAIPVYSKISLRWVIATAAVFMVLLFLNISIWKHLSTQPKNSALQQLVQENGWSNTDFYSMNYSK